MRYIITYLMLMLFAWPVHAVAQVSRIEQGAPLCIVQDKTEICHHYFSGEKISLPTDFTALYQGDECRGFRIRVMQPQSVLSAEPLPPIMIAPKDCAVAPTTVLTLPKVKRETRFDLVIETQNRNDQWAAAKTISIMSYPQTILTPLQKWSQKNTLIVVDDLGLLVPFLKKRNIAFQQDRYTAGKNKTVTIITGLKVAAPDTEGGVIVFREKVYDLPQIRSQDTKKGPRVYVEMKLLKNIDQNPLAMKMFMNIFQIGQGMTAEREDYYDEH